MKKRKILIVSVIIIFFLSFTLFFFMEKNKIKARDNIKAEKETSNNELKREIKKENISLSDILTFEKDSGIIRLYNEQGKMTDSIDLKFLADKNPVKKEAEKKPLVKNNKEENYVYVKTNKGLIPAQIEEGEIILYNQKGEEIDSIKIAEDTIKVPEIKEPEKIPEENKETKTTQLKTPVKTTFFTFRTINNELIFKDNTRNMLIKVDIINNKIATKILLKGLNLDKLNNVFVGGKSIYLCFVEDTNIVEIPIDNTDEKNIKKYDLGKIPDFILVKDNFIYYSSDTNFNKYDKNTKQTVKSIELGDKTTDIYIKDNIIYIINAFGEGKNNSVLIKLNSNNLTAEGIMELKGVHSKFIGINNNLAYIRQKDSIKEIDLKNFKPISAKEREEGVPVQVKDNILYSLKDGNLEKTNLSNNTKKSFNAEGFNIYLK